MLSEPADPGSIAAVASGWLADLARASSKTATPAVPAELLGPDSVVARHRVADGEIRSVSGQAAIPGMLGRGIKQVSPASIRASAAWPPILAPGPTVRSSRCYSVSRR